MIESVFFCLFQGAKIGKIRHQPKYSFSRNPELPVVQGQMAVFFFPGFHPLGCETEQLYFREMG